MDSSREVARETWGSYLDQITVDDRDGLRTVVRITRPVAFTG